ncbi:MAG: bifunctional UDP-sugar hydrolase/5'-nucleotidase [Lachnospiraceae bacterium]|nr:bifunctional UDP-sugar hydrolase/5'-nucleotidase [Lachnospiraceae bacterium]
MKKQILTLSAAAFMTALTCQTAFALDHDVVILHTNDTHCGIEENMGYAGLVWYENQMKEETPYVTLVDAGDAIQGAPVGTLSEGEYLVQIMNKAGYDFAVPGNHEFDYGMEKLLGLSARLDCGYSACNFVNLPSKTQVFAPYRIMEYDDIQVAFVGVATPESITKSTPAYFQDQFGRYRFSFCEDETGEALYSQVQSAVDQARGEGADYVIMVGHLGDNGITEKWSSRSVIANTTGIDAAIDGHSHEVCVENVPNENGEMVVLTQTGTKFANIGKLTITADGQIQASHVSAVTDAEGNPAKDAEMESFINGIKSQYEESLKVVLGRTDVDLMDKDPETGLRAVRKAETNLGDLCADASRYMMGADIGFMNGGGIRAGIEAGDITYEDALSVFPYGNMICMAEVSGQKIKDALEMGVKNYPEESGGFIHVSGLTYTVDSSVPSSVVLDEKRNFVSVDGEYRVRDIYVGEEPLDVNRTYTLASHNYWLKSGGDGMSMLMGCPILKDETMVDVDTITSYISEYLGGTVGEEYKDPRGQGRITIK